MTYFSLRKQQPEPDPEPVEEDIDEAEEEPDDDEEPTSTKQPASPKPPPGCLGVFILGARGLAAWLADRFGPGPALAAHLAAGWAVSHYKGWIPAAVVGGWLVLVGAFIPKAAAEQLAARIEQRDRGRSTPSVPTEAPAEGAESAAGDRPVEAPVDPLPGILWNLIGEAPGVHLKTVVAYLHQTGLDEACDRAAVRAALGRRRIPIRPSVREADGRVNQGVHREDLKAWEEALSQAPTEGGPKERSDPATTALTSDAAAPATAVATPPTPAT